MSQSIGTLEFFLLESGEYLERLDATAQAPAGAMTNADELLRLARAFRGGAIMASQHGMARAAQGLESVARAVREGRLQWNEATRGEVIRGIDDCKILLRRLRQPEQGDTEKAEAIGARLDRLSGRASAAMRAAAGPGLDAGGRAFVAREAAAIASVLQNAGRALRGDPASRDALNAISPAMSALRGVAVLNDLPPLGDILAAVESAVKDVLAGGAAAGDGPAIFDAAARALGRAAREVVDLGRPEADSDDAKGYAARLLASLSAGGAVVAIESLFFDDAGPHVVRQGTPPAAGHGLARVDMVSHGEFLNAAAAELARAGGGVQRDLRLFTVAANLRPMVGAGGTPLQAALSRLAEAARDAIGRGVASSDSGTFLRFLKQAADALAAAQNDDEMTLAQRLAAAASGLAGMAGDRGSVDRGTVAPATAVDRGTVAPVPQPPVPGSPSTVHGPRSTVPPLGEADLATSYLTLEQLMAEQGLTLGSLPELIAGGTAIPRGPMTVDREPVHGSPSTVHGPRSTPVPIESLAPSEPAVVDIGTLLYSADGARARLRVLKPAVLAAAGDSAALRALLDEVFDLADLAAGR